MPKKYTFDVKHYAVNYILDRLVQYKSVYGACQDLAPKLNIGVEILRRWVIQEQHDAEDRKARPAKSSPSSKPCAE